MLHRAIRTKYRDGGDAITMWLLDLIKSTESFRAGRQAVNGWRVPLPAYLPSVTSGLAEAISSFSATLSLFYVVRHSPGLGYPVGITDSFSIQFCYRS